MLLAISYSQPDPWILLRAPPSRSTAPCSPSVTQSYLVASCRALSASSGLEPLESHRRQALSSFEAPRSLNPN